MARFGSLLISRNFVPNFYTKS